MTRARSPRQRLAARAQEALELAQSLGDDWVAQDARSIARTTKFLTIDLADPASVASYVATGFTFDRGSFLSQDEAGTWRKLPGLLPRPPDRPGCGARLDVARPTYDIGTAFPVDPADIALARSYDLLIHLHDVREAMR